MKRIMILLLVMPLFFYSPHSQGQALFSLEDALERTDRHPDYKSWLQDLQTTEASLAAILEKAKPQLEWGGQILSFSYSLDSQAYAANTAPSLSFSQKSGRGTTLSASFSPAKELVRATDWAVKWSLSFSKSIWPPPTLSTDHLNLLSEEESLALLQKQRDYVLVNARFKIEELYVQAQLAEARIRFAQENLRDEENNLEATLAKMAIGEAGDGDLISARLGLLRAEKELEQARLTAREAKEHLQTALDLAGPLDLAPLGPKLSWKEETPSLPQDFDLDLTGHPLIWAHLAAIAKAERGLAAALASQKPGASLSLSLGEIPNTNQLQIKAALSVGYELLPAQAKQKPAEEGRQALDAAQERYQQAVADLERKMAAAQDRIKSTARDLEIAALTLDKARLELATARQQFALGALDQKTVERQESQFYQAELNYWQVDFEYGLLIRRLQRGILGDLTSGGVSR